MPPLPTTSPRKRHESRKSSPSSFPFERGSLYIPSETFLSCYEILDLDTLRWDVRLYKARRIDGAGQAHGDRADVKQAIWSLKKKNPGHAAGTGSSSIWTPRRSPFPRIANSPRVS